MSIIPKELSDRFEILSYGHALEILTSVFRSEWEDIVGCLNNLRVPLKTALKRENEIAVSDTRKADEAGLAPG